MNRLSAVVLSGMIMFSAASPNALADQNQTPATNSTSKVKAGDLARVPLHLVGFCFGSVIGVPICFARKLPQEIKEGGEGLAGSIKENSDNKLLLYPSMAVWLPCALVLTSLEAPFYSIKDAWMAERPFSKEQFSLGELDPPTDKK